MLGGVWDEASSPSRTGTVGIRALETGSEIGMTLCQNLIYRRFGSWGKRSGSAIVYTGQAAPSIQPQPTPTPPAPPYTPPSPTPNPVPKPIPNPGPPLH